MKFRSIQNPHVVLTFTEEFDIKEMLKHPEYEKVEDEVLSEEPKQEVKKVGRPKKTELGEE